MTISGCTHVGKTTLLRSLVRFLGALPILSTTTRSARPGEQGHAFCEYRFVQRGKEFDSYGPFIQKGFELGGYQYATSQADLIKILSQDDAIGVMCLVPAAVVPVRDFIRMYDQRQGGKPTIFLPIYITTLPKKLLVRQRRGDPNRSDAQRHKRLSDECGWDEAAKRGHPVDFVMIENNSSIEQLRVTAVGIIRKKRAAAS